MNPVGGIHVCHDGEIGLTCPVTGALVRVGSDMEQITVRSRPRVPAITCGSSATSTRLDRHLAVLGGPAVPQRETAEATMLMRELTSREVPRTRNTSRGTRISRVSLFAPLKRLRRSLFGNRG
ncbi:hypothetical protein SSPIM334S_00480 [Streptomyces spiroverticillatus]